MQPEPADLPARAAPVSNAHRPAVNTDEGIRVAREPIDRWTEEGIGISRWATEADATAAGDDPALAVALSHFPAVGFTFEARHTYELAVQG